MPEREQRRLGDAFHDGVDDIVALPTEQTAGVDPAIARQLAFALEKAVMRKRGTAAPKAATRPQRDLRAWG